MSGRWDVPGKRLSRRLLLLGLPLVLAGSMSSTPVFAVPPGSPSGPSLPDTKSVPVGAVPAKQSPAVPSVALQPAPIVVWPKGGSAVVPVASAVGATTAATAGRRDAIGVSAAGGLPVSVRRSPDQSSRSVDAEGSPTSVRVAVADRKAVEAIGLAGVVFSLSRADGAGVAGRVALDVEYTSFAHAYGADFGGRLTLVSLPACVLVTPDRPECRRPAPVPGARNVAAARTVSVDSVPVTGGGSDSSSVFAVTSSSSGEGGTFAATDLSLTYSWSAGSQAGDFGLSYPLKVPPSLGGPAPGLALRYSSGASDGMTFAQNGQVSPVGEGWNFSVGYIEQSYRVCREDGFNFGDLCQFSPDNATIVWGGKSTPLVKGAGGVWRAGSDDAWRIERLTDAAVANGDHEKEFWKITTLDGVQYFFGKHVRYAGDTAQTNSVQQVPVIGNNAGEACSAIPYGCLQAYRWNLDYVVDPRGNSMTYFWSKFRGKYGVHNNTVVAEYDLAAKLDRIEYGTRSGSESSPGAAAPMRVLFNNVERCLEVTCTVPGHWFDTPLDLYCATTATSCPNTLSPVFFTRYRLADITTQVLANPVGPVYRSVDKWRLLQSVMFSGDWISPAGNDTPPNLWLQSLEHAGFAADGTSTVEPLTTFNGTLMANRVYWGNSIGVAPYAHARITEVINGVGGKTVIDYSDVECLTSQTEPDHRNNPKRCFPQYSQPLSAPAAWVWFHKYVVDSVTEVDLVGGSPDETTSYAYSTLGSSSNVLWHHDNNEPTSMDYRTWAEWRGYSTVTTTHGPTTGPQSVTVDRFYRGMHNDRTATGWNTRVVTIDDSLTTGLQDHPALAGFLRERTIKDGANVVSSVIHEPTATLTATRAAPNIHTTSQDAYRVRETKTTNRVALEGGGWRTTVVDTAYEATYGLPTTVSDWGESGTGDNVCTDVTYTNPNTTSHLVNFRARELVHTCVAVGSRTDADYLKITDFFYDGATVNTTAPGQGLLTQTTGVKTVIGGVRTWATLARYGYDANGRVTSVKDGINRETTTAYTPAAGGPVTQMVVTNPAGHTTTTAFDFKGMPTTITDANSKVTTAAYDKLGRTTKVWLPGRSTSLTGNMEFVYTTPGSSPASITTKQLGPNGNQVTSYQIFDGRLRLRQIQSPAPQANGGRMIADTSYDGRGLVVKESKFWNNTSGPTSTLVSFADTAVLNQRRYSYDTLARPTVDALWSANLLKWQTTTGYSGNWTSVTPPTGGTATKVYFDADGNTTSLRQYLTPTPTTTQYQTTSYTYDRLGRLKTVTDPTANAWTYSYDLLGRVTGTTDPDKGSVTNTYDDAGQLLTTADARGITLSFTYNALGKRRTVWQGAVTTGTKLAEWFYDNLTSGALVKGQLAKSTRFHSSGSFTTEVTGYDDMYRPLGATVKVPTGQGALTGDWTIGTSYKVDGSVASNTFPAAPAAGLPAETVNYTYDDAGLPLTTVGLDTYVSGTTYYAWGDTYQRILGTGTKRIRLTTAVDEATGRLTANQTQTENQTTPNTWNHALTENYGYDPAGNVKTINEVNATGGTVANQCFNYDPLRQLTEAWTTTAATCQTAPSQPVVGGPDSYWTSYTYNPNGNRATDVTHATAGNTTRTYTYPASGATSVRPHAVTSVAATGASTGTDSYTYDNVGNALTRNIAGQPGQTLTWDAEGHLAHVVEPGGTTSYVTDAGGNRLLETRPDNSATLYLSGYELTRAAGGALSGTRHYGAATRSGAGLTWLATDHHNTAQLSINPTTLAVTRRKTDPFGNPRGADPVWPNTRSFVNGIKNATGLIHLGAREYDRRIGRFLSVDPMIDHASPQQMNGYAYGDSNPVTMADPTGMFRCDGLPADECNLSKQAQGYRVYSGTGAKKTCVVNCVPRARSKPSGSNGLILDHSGVVNAQAYNDGTLIINGYRVPGQVQNPIGFLGLIEARKQKLTGLGLADGRYLDVRAIHNVCEMTQQCPPEMVAMLTVDLVNFLEIEQPYEPTATDAAIAGAIELGMAAGGFGKRRRGDGASAWPRQTGGNCQSCAIRIQAMIGGDIATIKPTGGAPKLGSSKHNPAGNWDHHVVVVKDGRVYDSFTGPDGLTKDQYKSQFTYKDDIDFGF